MSIEVRNDIFTFLDLSARNLNVSCFELGFLVLVVAGHSFEFQTHVVGAHIPVCKLSELVSIKLVIHFVIDGFLLKLLQGYDQFLFEKLLHCSVLFLDVEVFRLIYGLLQLDCQFTIENYVE